MNGYEPLLAALLALLAGLAIGKAWERYKLRDGKWFDRRRVRQSPHYILGLNFLVANQIDSAIEELGRAASLDGDALEVSGDVYLSAAPALIRHALSSSPDPQVRLIVGYAGWAPGQLDEELASSSWLMAPVQPDLLFDVPIDAMWETAIRRLGAEPSALQASTGVH